MTLIICTYMRPKPVDTLLQAIVEQTYIPDEIIIIDGSKNCETEAVAQKWIAKIPTTLKYLLVADEDRGLTRQRNIGITQATGDYVAFLDDDTVPASDYFERVLESFLRSPDVVGVGGYIINELKWKQVDARTSVKLKHFRFGDWERREDYRWRLRKTLGLVSKELPCWMPPCGHGRSIGHYPPDGKEYAVEYIMGCACSFTKEILTTYKFSRFFGGYGLYEDLEYCIRVAQHGKIVLNTAAQLAHYHDPDGRPNRFHYGVMVVRNGWFVWRQRWEQPTTLDRLRWWSTTLLLALCRLLDTAREGKPALTEVIGRCYGATTLLWDKPLDAHSRASERCLTE